LCETLREHQRVLPADEGATYREFNTRTAILHLVESGGTDALLSAVLVLAFDAPFSADRREEEGRGESTMGVSSSPESCVRAPRCASSAVATRIGRAR